MGALILTNKVASSQGCQGVQSTCVVHFSLIHLIDCRLGWDVNLQLEAITAITPISLHSELLSQEQVCSRLSFSKALGQDSEDNCLAFYKTTGYTMIYWIKFSDLAIWFNNVYWSTIMDLRCQIVEIEKFTYINICWLAKKSLYILVFLETFLHSLYSWKHFLCKSELWHFICGLQNSTGQYKVTVQFTVQFKATGMPLLLLQSSGLQRFTFYDW